MSDDPGQVIIAGAADILDGIERSFARDGFSPELLDSLDDLRRLLFPEPANDGTPASALGPTHRPAMAELCGRMDRLIEHARTQAEALAGEQAAVMAMRSLHHTDAHERASQGSLLLVDA